MQSNERRLYVRARVVATATAWVRGLCRGSYIVENLSLGGVYLSGGPAVRAGEELKLVLELPQGPIEVRGKVVRSEAQARDWSLAVRFDSLPRRTSEAIGKVVAQALDAAARDASLRPEPTVLVVDDSFYVREALVRDIRCAGWEVASFSTSLDALDYLDRPESCIRVALIDPLGMRDGTELLSYLADERPSIRRILMAEEGVPEAGELGPLLGRADAVLAKPWDQETLARTIMSVN